MSAATPTSPGFPLTMGSGAMSNFAGPSSSSGSPVGASRPTTPLSAGFTSSVPSGPTYEDIRRWDDAEVATWLSTSRLGHHASTFAENDIRGSVLLDVDQAALKDMGITSVGDRVRIFAAIKALNKRCAEQAIAARRPSVSSLPPLSPLSSTYPMHSDGGEMEFLEHDAQMDGSMDGMAGSVGYNSMGLRRGQMRPPPLTLKQSTSRGMPGHASPVGTLNNGQGFGLSAARGLTPGAARGSIRNPATSSSSNKPMSADASLHRKVNSVGGGGALGSGISSSSAAPPISQSKPSSASGTRVNQVAASVSAGRPSTATGAGGYTSLHSHSSSRNMNGGADLSQRSPTGASFGAPNGARPSTAIGSQSYGSGAGAMSSGTRDAYSPLTPISESNSHGTTPTTPSALHLQQMAASSGSAGYSVGRGAFANSQRSTPSSSTRDWQGSASSATSAQSQQATHAIRRIDSGEGYNAGAAYYGYAQPNPPTLEDLKRRTIKFISEEDNTTRIVNVSDCRDAYDVMSRVLKKFGKPPSGNSYTPTADQGPTGDDLGAVETWGIFATSADGQNTKALSDNELLAICHAPQPHDPLRERGLTLRRIPNHLPGEDGRRVPPRSGRHKLEAFFGERMPVAQMQPVGGSAGTAEEDDAGSVTISGKKMKRASTVSIMSGLGVGPFSHRSSDNKHGATPVAAAATSGNRKDGKTTTANPASPGAVVAKPSKIRNFFGQRPPSELINTNLADFFPSTEPKALQRTARRSIYGRASASTRSKRNSTWSFVADPDAPPLPGKESFDGSARMSEETQLHPSSSSIRERGTSGTTPIIQIGYDSRSEDDASMSEVKGRRKDSGDESPPTLPPVVGRNSLEEWSRDLKAVGSPVAEYSGSFAANQQHSQQHPKHSSTASSHHTHSAGDRGSGFSSYRPGVSRRTSGESTRSRRSLASQIRHGLSAARERNADAVSLLTVDEITQEVENRRESMSLAGAGGGWVVDEDGVPIPIPGESSRSARSSSVAASTRPSSGISSSVHGQVVSEEEEDEEEQGDADPSLDVGAAGTKGRPQADAPRPSIDLTATPARVSRGSNVSGNSAAGVLQAPGEELDRHLGDPMAVTRSTTSRASSVSELRRSLNHPQDSEDDAESEFDSDMDSSDGDEASETDEEDDVVDDHAASVSNAAAAASKAPIKWHKGALIGAGSFGNVFLGMNAKTGLLMAVKQVELPSGDSHLDQRKKNMLEALESEIKLLKTLEHDNIVQYLDSFADGSHLNIFLEYVPGGSIVALLRNYGAFEEPLVRNFVRQILNGLSFLHNKGIMHRDIKGANILVDNKGGIKISDFGISKKVESELVLSSTTSGPGGTATSAATKAGNRPSLQGSVFWMAPEVVKQTSYTIKADIWSLGCLVLEMISGTHPWADLNQMQALFQIGMGRKPQFPEEISDECKNFLEKTFELDYNKRPSAEELLGHAFMGTKMTFSSNNVEEEADAVEGGEGDPTATASAETESEETSEMETTLDANHHRTSRSNASATKDPSSSSSADISNTVVDTSPTDPIGKGETVEDLTEDAPTQKEKKSHHRSKSTRRSDKRNKDSPTAAANESSQVSPGAANTLTTSTSVGTGSVEDSSSKTPTTSSRKDSGGVTASTSTSDQEALASPPEGKTPKSSTNKPAPDPPATTLLPPPALADSPGRKE